MNSVSIIIGSIVGVTIVVLFLYYGYRDDYRRDKKNF